MPTTIDIFPSVPSRATQGRAEFSAATDDFLSRFNPFVLQANALAGELNELAATITAAVDDALDAVDRAEAAAAFKVSFAAESWAVLSAITGSYVGQSAAVFGQAGNHTDPVVGGSVANTGIYRWSASPAGWKWISSGVGATVAWTDISGKPSTFAPSAHTHSIADIISLQGALDAKAVAGGVATSGLTMATARLLGRSTGGTGAVEEITLGEGLGLTGGVLSYTGSSDMVYPGAGIAVSTGTGWATSLTIPGGQLVGTTAAQALTNKTLGSGTVITAGTISGVTITGGELRAGVTVSDTGTIDANSPGRRGMPVVAVTNRTVTAADMGKVVEFTGTATLPANLPAGFNCTFDNGGNSTATIARSGGQVLRKGNTTPTSLSLAARGTAACWMNNAGELKFVGDI